MIEVIRLKRGKKCSDNGYFIRVSADEALTIITSLSEQLRTKTANGHRAEQWTTEHEYFSIAVAPVEPKEKA